MDRASRAGVNPFSSDNLMSIPGSSLIEIEFVYLMKKIYRISYLTNVERPTNNFFLNYLLYKTSTASEVVNLPCEPFIRLWHSCATTHFNVSTDSLHRINSFWLMTYFNCINYSLRKKLLQGLNSISVW